MLRIYIQTGVAHIISVAKLQLQPLNQVVVSGPIAFYRDYHASHALVQHRHLVGTLVLMPDCLYSTYL